MPKDHIIPKFILKGFAINPNINPKNQQIKIFDTKTKQVKKQKINDSFMIEGFNSQKTEQYLAYEYEDGISKIFHKIRNAAYKNEKAVSLNNKEYKLLFRFFIIMWRRNDIQIEKIIEAAESMMQILSLIGCKDIIAPEFKNKKVGEIIDDQRETIIKDFFEVIITNTDDEDPTVKKTLKYYKPIIVYNTSNIHYFLHNSYGTIRYTNSEEFPNLIIEPISNVLLFCLILTETVIDLESNIYEIPIEVYKDSKSVINNFIYGYLTPVATKIVVDETNIEIVKEYYNNN